MPINEDAKNALIAHVTELRDGPLEMESFSEGVVLLALKMVGIDPYGELKTLADVRARKGAYKAASEELRRVSNHAATDERVYPQVLAALEALEDAIKSLDHPATGDAPAENRVLLSQLSEGGQAMLELAQVVVGKGCKSEQPLREGDHAGFTGDASALNEARSFVAGQIAEKAQLLPSTEGFEGEATCLRGFQAAHHLSREQVKEALERHRELDGGEWLSLLRQWLLLDEAYGCKKAIASVTKLEANEAARVEAQRGWFERHASDLYYALSCVLIFGAVAAMYMAFPPAAVVVADNVLFGGLICGTMGALLYMLLNLLVPLSMQSLRGLVSAYQVLSFLALMLLVGGVAAILAPTMPAVLMGVMSALSWKILVACSVGVGVFGAAILIHTVRNGPSDDGHSPLLGYALKALLASLLMMPMIMVLMPGAVWAFVATVLPHAAITGGAMVTTAQLSSLTLQGLVVGTAILYGVIAAIQTVGAGCKWIARDVFVQSKTTSRYFNGMGTGLVVSAPLVVVHAVATFLELGKAWLPTLLDDFFAKVGVGMALMGVWLGGLIGVLGAPIEEEEGKPWDNLNPVDCAGDPSNPELFHTAIVEGVGGSIHVPLEKNGAPGPN